MTQSTDLRWVDDALWRTLASRRRSFRTLSEAIDHIGLPHGEQLTVETIISPSGEDPLHLLADRLRRRVEYVKTATFSALRVEDNNYGGFVLSAWPTVDSGVFNLVASMPLNDRRWKKAERWLTSAAPNIATCYLNQDQFFEVVRSVSELGKAHVSRFTARKIIDDSSIIRHFKSNAKLPPPAPDDVISEVLSSGASIRTMAFSVAGQMSLHLRRTAGATFYGGEFSVFDTTVVASLARFAGQRRRLLSGRARHVGDLLSRPISIVLPEPILKSKEDTGVIVSELQRSSNLNIAVLHRNPYLHVVVTDQEDGSNFDVFVTDPSQVDIYPGYRASTGSLARISQTLSARLFGTDIEEKPPQRLVSLDDLVTAG